MLPKNLTLRRVQPSLLMRRNLSQTRARLKTFEPDYLDRTKELPPTLPLMNISLKGYDFHILESYQSYLHNTCLNMGFSVGDSWAAPCKSLKVNTFKVGGTIVEETYELNLYERNVQLARFRSVDASPLMALIRTTLPQGVRVSVHRHEDAVHFEERFIPDPFVEGIKTQLKEMEEKVAEEVEAKQAVKQAKAAKKKEALLASLEDIDDDDYF